MKEIFKFMLAIICVFAAGCSGDEPGGGNNEPEGGGQINPDSEVDDPTGTVLISMRNGNNGDTSLDGLRIGKDDNFHGSGWKISSVGKVKGLGNVSTIPSSGWSEQVAVVPGSGYVAYNSYSDTYYRLYVVDYITAAVSGGIIGADVKYQKPFKGLDQDIKLDKQFITFTGDGGSEQVVFENNTIIPFEVKSSQPWCTVKKASTREESFLYDAILISAEQSQSAKDQTAEITIKTLYDREVTITVTRKARGAFITPSQSLVNFLTFNRVSTEYIGLYTNIEPSDIKIHSDQEWLSAAIEDRAKMPARRIVSVDGKSMTRALLENPIEKTLAITCQPNGGELREGKITLSYNNVREEVMVTQEGSGFRLFSNEVEFDADKNLEVKLGYHPGNVDHYSIKCEYENGCEDWLSVRVIDWQNILFTAKINPETKDRIGNVRLYYENGGTKFDLATVRVIQRGMKYEDLNMYFNRESQNFTLTYPLPAGTKVQSSESWCSATPSGQTLVFRVSESSVNRSCVISFTGINAKIYVSQSKYKVGDKYSENGIDGRVCSMIEGVGMVYKLLGYAAWSNENVNLLDASSLDDGVANMNAVKKIPYWQSLYPAFAAVNKLNATNDNGWYFPAKNQLQAVCPVIRTFAADDGYQNYDCWSSSNYNVNTAYYLSGSNAYQKHKDAKLLIPAIHDFSYNFNK